MVLTDLPVPQRSALRERSLPQGALRAPARSAAEPLREPPVPLGLGGAMYEDDFPTNPSELPDGSPQQFDALARQRRLRQERQQPPDELPPVA